MIYAIYVRVSTAQQIDNTSLDEQIDLCKQSAYKMGATENNILVYREEGFTGEDIDIRPTMMRLREDVANGLVKHVICTHPDRFSRDLTDKLLVVREFEKNGAAISFTDTEFEKSPEGILFFNIIATIASYELSLIRKRTVRGRERAVRELNKIMPMRVAPFGYDKDENGQLVINDSEATYVKQIYEWYVYDNLKTREIGDRLYENGVIPKRGESKNWSASSIGRVLSSEIYIGNYYYNRRKTKKVKGQTTKTGQPKKTLSQRNPEEWIHVAVPAIIDKGLFDLAQKQKEKNNTNKHVGNQKFQFLLKSLLKCGHCGRTLDATTYSGRADKLTGKRTRYRCYRCPNQAPKKYGPEVQKCMSQSLRADIMEEYMWQEIVKLISDPEHFMKLATQKHEGVDELKALLNQIEQQIALKEKEKEKVKLMFRREVISEEEMISDMTQLNSSLLKLDKELKRYQSQVKMFNQDELVSEQMQSIVTRIHEKLKQADDLCFEQKRHVVELLFDEIIIRFDYKEDGQLYLMITSIGAYDKLLKQNDGIGVRLQSQEIR